jgi:hypothetical protein
VDASKQSGHAVGKEEKERLAGLIGVSPPKRPYNLPVVERKSLPNSFDVRLSPTVNFRQVPCKLPQRSMNHDGKRRADEATTGPGSDGRIWPSSCFAGCQQAVRAMIFLSVSVRCRISSLATRKIVCPVDVRTRGLDQTRKHQSGRPRRFGKLVGTETNVRGACWLDTGATTHVGFWSAGLIYRLTCQQEITATARFGTEFGTETSATVPAVPQTAPSLSEHKTSGAPLLVLSHPCRATLAARPPSPLMICVCPATRFRNQRHLFRRPCMPDAFREWASCRDRSRAGSRQW